MSPKERESQQEKPPESQPEHVGEIPLEDQASRFSATTDLSDEEDHGFCTPKGDRSVASSAEEQRQQPEATTTTDKNGIVLPKPESNQSSAGIPRVVVESRTIPEQHVESDPNSQKYRPVEMSQTQKNTATQTQTSKEQTHPSTTTSKEQDFSANNVVNTQPHSTTTAPSDKLIPRKIHEMAPKSLAELDDTTSNHNSNPEKDLDSTNTATAAGQRSPPHSKSPSPVVNTNAEENGHRRFTRLPSNDDISDASLVVSQSNAPYIQQPHPHDPSFMQATIPHSFGYGIPAHVAVTAPVPPVPQHILTHAPAVPPVPQHILTTPSVAHSVTGQPGSVVGGAMGSGRRKIVLRLEEEIIQDRRSFFFRRTPSRRSSFLRRASQLQSVEEQRAIADRGSVTVSWFEGTTSSELQGHVRRMVMRKIGLGRSTELIDMRIIDQNMEPPEEIVLSPFIPDGSHFLLRFSTGDPDSDDYGHKSAPDSPPSLSQSGAVLGAQVLAGAAGRLKDLQPELEKEQKAHAPTTTTTASTTENVKPGTQVDLAGESNNTNINDEAASKSSDVGGVMGYNPEDQVEARLRELAELLIVDRRTRKKFSARRSKEKRQVIFVLANYFVLFLSLIAISAEIQARLPSWLQWVETQLQSVQKCATDQDALFECVSKGDVSGLIASFILWISRSAATKRFFLFGFESPKRLWTVVYEALVTAFCWGTSYMLIRRGMNPETRSNFLRKYWKDAVYGSLAGFNASFMKQVLKNLIPQEALEDALQERQHILLSWLPKFH